MNAAVMIGFPPWAHLLMAAAVPRLVTRRDRSSRAVARALRSTALGRAPAEERVWTNRIEARRGDLLSREESIEVSEHEFEGPAKLPLATWWLSLPPVWCAFLMRLVGELGPRSALELGSGLGVSGAYQGAALKRNGAGGGLVTLEVSEQRAELAREGFRELGLADTVELRLGDIAQTLPGVLDELAPLHYAFIDAEHTEHATIAYFDSLAPHLAPGAVVVIDDVTYPEPSRRAWRAISRRPAVARAVWLGRVGVVVASDT